MKGCLASRAAVLFVAFAIGACVVLPLCSSVPVSAVGDSKSLRGKDGSEVATGVTRSGLDVISPEGTSDESGQSQSVSGRKTPVARWRSSSSGFLKRFGKGPKFLLSVSVILGTALLLSRAGNVLLKCLAGMGGRRQRPSEGPESEACDRLREWSENDDQATELAKLLPSGSLRASIPQKVVMTAALLSLIAIALANPITPTVKEEGMKPTTPGTEDDLSENVGSISAATSSVDVGNLDPTLPTDYSPDVTTDEDEEEFDDDVDLGENTDLDDEKVRRLLEGISYEEIERHTLKPEDDSRPVVEFDGDNVKIGEKWKDKDGQPKQGSQAAVVELTYQHKKFKVWLSKYTEASLAGDKLLEKVKDVLRSRPAMEGKIRVWGKDVPNTVLALQDLKDADVPFQLYLPKNSFGIKKDSDLPREQDQQAWYDLWITTYYVLYVGEKGTLPPTRDYMTTYDVLRVLGDLARAVLSHLWW